MPVTTFSPQDPLINDLLHSLDNLFGLHAGFRPVHAKGAFCSGVFTPTAAAAQLTRAPHANRPSTPVTVRFSDFAGVPAIPDNDPQAAGPRGMAVRFQLADHVHTDIVAHSADGFPVRTGEAFLEFARALATSGPTAAKPTALDQFLEKHPETVRFVKIPKPIPSSFARESFFAVSALKFANASGESRQGRIRIRPSLGSDYLTPDDAARKSPSFLVDELSARLASEPIRFIIYVQIAEGGDVVENATIPWPTTRTEIEFGKLTLFKREDDQSPELKKIIFDPIPRVDGIEATEDPLYEVRAAIYLLSGRRRRAATPN